MLCPKCGKQNREGASYCTECGRLLIRRAACRTKQPHRGKNLAVAVSLLTIAAAAIVFFIFFSGTPVEGQWYSENEFSLIDFKDGQVRIAGLSGTQRSEYEYNRQKGEGTLTIDGNTCQFIVEKDELTLQKPEGDIKFSRAKEEFNTEDFVTEGLLGLWSNERAAQVLELKENGEITIYSIEGEEASSYDYDIEKGEGSFIIGGKKLVFNADLKELNIKGTGIFIRQKSGFDIAAFIEKYGNPLKGVWYDASGVMGRFQFQDEDILFVTSYGKEYQGTYKFNNTESGGVLSFGGKTMDIAYSAGILKIRGQIFTKDFVKQKGKDALFEQLEGIWYDKQGNGTVKFSSDGTAVFIRDGNMLNAGCSFDPLDGTGELTVYYESRVKAVKLLLSNGMLAADEWLYTREVIEQADSGITGTWYDSEGRVGTLTLKADGNAELIFAGSKYNGTYSFNETLGKGTITTIYGGQEWTFELELQGELLVVRTGILFYDEIVFSREAVKQP